MWNSSKGFHLEDARGDIDQWLDDYDYDDDIALNVNVTIQESEKEAEQILQDEYEKSLIESRIITNEVLDKYSFLSEFMEEINIKNAIIEKRETPESILSLKWKYEDDSTWAIWRMYFVVNKNEEIIKVPLQEKYTDVNWVDDDVVLWESEEVWKYINSDSKYVLTYFVDSQPMDRTVSILEL